MDEKSLQTRTRCVSLSQTSTKRTRYLHLRDVVDVAHARRPGDLGRVGLVPIELRVDVLCDLRERVRRVLGPEVVLRIEVVGLLGKLAVLGRLA